MHEPVSHFTAPKYLISSVLALFAASAMAAETVTVRCYLGNPGDHRVIGEIEVLDVRDGNRACNSQYKDCMQDCTGCYLDTDGQEYCFDKEGKKFRR